MRTRRPWLISLAVACGISACKRDPPAATSPDCELHDASGRAQPVTLDALSDPIATLVLRGGCPADVAAVQAKLAEVDARDCDGGDMFAADRTTLISERAQLRGTGAGELEDCTPKPAAIYRGLVQHTCAGRAPWQLWLSVVPLATVVDDMPEDLEAIGWDPKAEVFDFYTLEEGRWIFHGSSHDMQRGMAEDGARRCAACHVGGGLVMKELDSPWAYWEGRLTTPGVDAILTAHPELGSRTEGKVLDFRPAGKELEDAIVAGNAAWVKARVEHLRAHGTTAELLHPLFCSDEINLAAATDTASPTWQTGATEGALEVSAALLVGPRLAEGVRLRLPLAAYHDALSRGHQRVETDCGAALVDDEGRPVVDAPFDLLHPRRARIDVQYVEALVDAGVVDAALADAVRGVDFTRPIFSKARCGLLDAVGELEPSARNPAGIRAALQRAARADGAANVQLSRNLDDPATVPTLVDHFLRTCAARDPEALTEDIVAWVSWLRREARAQPVIELAEMLPTDDRKAADELHFDPGTCRLVGAS